MTRSLNGYLREAAAAVGGLSALLPPEAALWRIEQPLQAVRPQPNQPARLQAIGTFFAATAWTGAAEAPRAELQSDAQPEPQSEAQSGALSRPDPASNPLRPEAPVSRELQTALLAQQPMAPRGLESLLPSAGLRLPQAEPSLLASPLLQSLGPFFAGASWQSAAPPAANMPGGHEPESVQLAEPDAPSAGDLLELPVERFFASVAWLGRTAAAVSGPVTFREEFHW